MGIAPTCFTDSIRTLNLNKENSHKKGTGAEDRRQEASWWSHAQQQVYTIKRSGEGQVPSSG